MWNEHLKDNSENPVDLGRSRKPVRYVGYPWSKTEKSRVTTKLLDRVIFSRHLIWNTQRNTNIVPKCCIVPIWGSPGFEFWARVDSSSTCMQCELSIRKEQLFTLDEKVHIWYGYGKTARYYARRNCKRMWCITLNDFDNLQR